MDFQDNFVGSFDFEVAFGSVHLGFSKISNLEAKVEYDTIQEGGNNCPILLPKPRTQADVITFEKGMILSKEKTGWDRIKPGMKLAGILVYVKRNGKNVKTLCIDEGLVVAKEYPLLDASSSSLYVEKLQIAHSGIREEFISSS